MTSVFLRYVEQVVIPGTIQKGGQGVLPLVVGKGGAATVGSLIPLKPPRADSAFPRLCILNTPLKASAVSWAFRQFHSGGVFVSHFHSSRASVLYGGSLPLLGPPGRSSETFFCVVLEQVAPFYVLRLQGRYKRFIRYSDEGAPPPKKRPLPLCGRGCFFGGGAIILNTCTKVAQNKRGIKGKKKASGKSWWIPEGITFRLSRTRRFKGRNEYTRTRENKQAGS